MAVECSRFSNSKRKFRIRQILTQKLQRIVWVYLTKNFIITSVTDVQSSEPATKCSFIPITFDNYFRVGDFREKSRIAEYRGKLVHQELGFFVACEGKMIASIWATINDTKVPAIMRGHMRLAPNEALVHDIVTGENFRGMGVGPFMVSRIASTLLNDHRVDKIIIDVNSRNNASLRMMEKVGLRMKEKILSISVFGRLVLQKAVGR